jgi:hypothetical protein
MCLLQLRCPISTLPAFAACLQVKPLAWPMHTHRKVLNEALHSPASNAELAAATAAVQAEFARLGRFSSFSSHQLAAQPVPGQGSLATADAACEEAGSSSSGSSHVRLALVPGTMGPRTQASAAALEALEAAAAASAGSSSSSKAGGELQQEQAGQGQQHAAEQQQQEHEAVGSDRSVSGVLCEMDAALIGLMQDMDIVMPGEGAATDERP